MLGFVSSPDMVAHDTLPHHPERPDRLRAIHQAVRDAGLIASPNPFPDFRIDLGIARQSHRLVEIDPVVATESHLRLVHPPQMIDQVRHACLHRGVLDQGDTPTCPASFDAALLSLGCCIGADAVMRGQVRRAFAAARPPGHHAEPDRSMGFCLFSNVAIVARHLQRAYDVSRVAIVDFDVHHGNGTQACFEDDGSVLFVSLHQHPDTLYPRTGHAWEVGDGAGRGTTLNLPVNPGAGDATYLALIEQRVLPAIDRFKPQVLLLSAGFDAHAEDPLAHAEVTDDGFDGITRLLASAANVHCGGRVVSCLEGGYNLVTLGRSVVRHLVALAET
jgi:acetoin utilization deacetylase AcuC-like enzyme